jgi:Uma2 family endonuclease
VKVVAVAGRNRLHNVDEFERFIALNENRNRYFELIDGMIVEGMPTQAHAAIVALLNGHFFVYLQQNPVGWALVEARYQLAGDEHNARLPDLSFVSRERGPLVEHGPAAYVPDLAIEVQSPDDNLKEMAEKAQYYLAHGSHMVWLVYLKRLVEVLTPTNRQLLNEDEAIDGGDALPGFSVLVKDIFPKG